MDTAKAIRITFSAFLLLAIFISVPSSSAMTGNTGTPEFAAKIGQGNLALLRFDAPQGVGELIGKLRDMEMTFFKDPGKNSLIPPNPPLEKGVTFYSLISAPLEMEQGIHLVELETLENQANETRTRLRFYPLVIEETEFESENIRVPKRMVDY